MSSTDLDSSTVRARFHPAFLERTLPELEAQSLCISAIVPLDGEGFETKARALHVRAAIEEASEKLKKRAGLHPHFSDQERATLNERLHAIASMGDEELRPFASDRTLAIYVTPAHSVVLGLSDRFEKMTMIGDHPYALSLHELAQHFHGHFFYLVDLAMDAMKFWKVSAEGEAELIFDRAMKDEMDYRPAADHADDDDAPLQSHSGGGSGDSAVSTANSAIFHGHAIEDTEHFEARQKRFWRDCIEESQVVWGESNAPLVLRGETRQRSALLNKLDLKPEDFAAQHDLQHGGTMNEQMLELLKDLDLDTIQHQRLRRRWERAQGSGRTATELHIIARQAAQGMIETLMIRKDAPIWGEYAEESGDLLVHDNERMSSGEVRDLIARKVLQLGGELHVLDPEAMPVEGPLCAILRGTVA